MKLNQFKFKPIHDSIVMVSLAVVLRKICLVVICFSVLIFLLNIFISTSYIYIHPGILLFLVILAGGITSILKHNL